MHLPHSPSDDNLSGMTALMENTALWAALAGLVSAQLLKPLISVLTGEPFRPYLFITTGGMPSSHTSAIIALTVSVALTEGLDSSMFAICIILSLVIMNDATNVRLETGKQAKLLNEWSEIFSLKDSKISPLNLKTAIGHSLNQVLGGLVLGLIVGYVVTMLLTNG